MSQPLDISQMCVNKTATQSLDSLFTLTSSCGDAESSLRDRYMAMCGTCPMDIWSSAVSSPHSRRTSWLTGGQAFVLRTDDVSAGLLLSTGATVSKDNLTWRKQRQDRWRIRVEIRKRKFEIPVVEQEIRKWKAESFISYIIASDYLTSQSFIHS